MLAEQQTQNIKLSVKVNRTNEEGAGIINGGRNKKMNLKESIT